MCSHRSLGPLVAGALLLVAPACAHARGSGDAGGERSRDARGSLVTSEETERTSPRSLADLLIGRVAGVHVTQTEHGIAVRIRGAVAIHGSTAPLYVIDGMPIDPGPAGALAGLSPQEIESIEVLKDAIDTTMYGVRGANGVILITTKRPRW